MVFRASANTKLTFEHTASHRRSAVHGLSTHSVHYHSRPVHDRTYSTEIPLHTAGNLPLPRQNIIICSHASNIITLPPYDCKGVIPNLQIFNIEFSSLFQEFFVQFYKIAFFPNISRRIGHTISFAVYPAAAKIIRERRYGQLRLYPPHLCGNHMSRFRRNSSA